MADYNQNNYQNNRNNYGSNESNYYGSGYNDSGYGAGYNSSYGYDDDLENNLDNGYQMDTKMKRGFDKEYRHKKTDRKETKVWHWIVMDLLTIAICAVGWFLTVALAPVLGAMCYAILPIMIVVSMMIITFLPMIPSGIRTFYTWTMTKLISILIIFLLACDVALPGFQDKVVNMANEFAVVLGENKGHISNEEMQEMIKENLSGGKDAEEAKKDSESNDANGTETDVTEESKTEETNNS